MPLIYDQTGVTMRWGCEAMMRRGASQQATVSDHRGGRVVTGPPSLELVEADLSVLVSVHDHYSCFNLRRPQLRPQWLKTARASGLGLYIEQRNVTWVDAHKKDRRTREKRQGAGRHRQERDRQRDKERGQETWTDRQTDRQTCRQTDIWKFYYG